jgi:hypothetical protein
MCGEVTLLLASLQVAAAEVGRRRHPTFCRSLAVYMFCLMVAGWVAGAREYMAAAVNWSAQAGATNLVQHKHSPPGH